MADSPIIKAAKQGDSETVRRQIADNPASVHERTSDESTPLHCAAWKGHVEICRLLLDSGADVNAKNLNDHYGNTPLHAAAHGNRKEVAELLVSRGADVHAINASGRTPLEETAIHNAVPVAKFLRSLA